jgi:hypothetical protein
MNNFRPCPFCGCTYPDNPKDVPAFPGNREATYWIVRCGASDCTAEVVGNTPEEALARWNRRHGDPVPFNLDEYDSLNLPGIDNGRSNRG